MNLLRNERSLVGMFPTKWFQPDDVWAFYSANDKYAPKTENIQNLGAKFVIKITSYTTNSENEWSYF